MSFLAVVQDVESAELADNVAAEMGFVEPKIIHGTPLDVVSFLATNDKFIPLYLLIDIGNRGAEAIPEIDELAQHCVENTKVVIMGHTNDLNLYRQLLQKGVAEYFTKPASIQDIKGAFFRNNIENPKPALTNAGGKIISFMSSASGDGATTVALNVAYQLAKELQQKVVIVDMDYQFGMLARDLDLPASYGIRELYEHPEGSIDLTLLEKTAIPYKDNLSVIAAPKNLRFVPNITPNMIGNLLYTLKSRYKYVILDLPHIWSEWVATVLKEVDHNYLVSQLWLKSATHASRFLDAMQSNSVFTSKISLILNRSGSKFKEAITPAEFAAVCKKKISHYITNDSKTITMAENQGKTAIEIGNSVLNRQFLEIASSISEMKQESVGD